MQRGCGKSSICQCGLPVSSLSMLWFPLCTLWLNQLQAGVIRDSSVFSHWFWPVGRLSRALWVYTQRAQKGQLLNNESSIMTPYWVKVALYAAGRPCVSVVMEWHLAGIMFHAWGCALFVIMIPSLCICPHYLNQFYNSQQSTLKQEVRTHNNGLLNLFFFFFFFLLLLLYVSSPASQ